MRTRIVLQASSTSTRLCAKPTQTITSTDGRSVSSRKASSKSRRRVTRTRENHFPKPPRPIAQRSSASPRPALNPSSTPHHPLSPMHPVHTMQPLQPGHKANRPILPRVSPQKRHRRSMPSWTTTRPLRSRPPYTVTRIPLHCPQPTQSGNGQNCHLTRMMIQRRTRRPSIESSRDQRVEARAGRKGRDPRPG